MWAPVPEPPTILRIPVFEFVAVAISPIQPRWLPPTCRLLIDDSEQEWIRGGKSVAKSRSATIPSSKKLPRGRNCLLRRLVCARKAGNGLRRTNSGKLTRSHRGRRRYSGFNACRSPGCRDAE
ncbi:hypothetical protein Cob_v003285 [Colletotrichum orbiculare MAFF 240422]|uniref:Uncharacterized protein n=1 Tax=Colletotrichum orbiculare (strain 104-T / ATCC 96160 / CBS 514.97 / LARS 414 / MAFF 240422) TaxID=1213857 RepID=A0A484G288_COLOR|nr:hypothetical protein Cob_v003285 [Colletotrichum orbiculare MAFF 240422]